jgi:hypothetical protein
MIPLGGLITLAVFALTAIYVLARMLKDQQKTIAQLVNAVTDNKSVMASYSAPDAPMPEFIPWGDGGGFYRQPDGSYIPMGPDGRILPNPARTERPSATTMDVEGTMPGSRGPVEVTEEA